jgi:hypothetical protein
MADEMFSGNIGEIQLAGAASGVALTTTAAFTSLPEGTHWISLTPRNFATAVVARFLFCPYLIIAKTTDLGVAATNWTEYSSEAQDADTGTSVTLSSLDTIANGDALYVGSHVTFAGAHIDVDGTNSNANNLTVKYRKSDDTWADISDTDNTDTGASLAQDGTVTWTVPSDWVQASLTDTGDVTLAHSTHTDNDQIYWTRWEWNAAMDSSVTLDHMIAIPRLTTYAELVAGQTLETTITMGPGGVGGVVALTNAGTANLLINCGTRSSSRIFV